MSQGWYIDSAGKVTGPVSARELQRLAEAGRILPTDRVSPDGNKWVSAAKVKGLTFTASPPPPPPTPPPAAPPQSLVETLESRTDQIPGYQIAGVLGKGACGVVFRARQTNLDRVVALKMVLSDRRPSPSALARFQKEAVSLAKLKHPNIVGIYDCGHHDGQAYFAMELLDGEDLGNRIERDGTLAEPTAWHVARQTAAALAHAADLGVYHRDIKPANLFLTPPPTGYPLPPGVPLVKVTDFGLALSRQAADEASDPRLTAAGVILGTPAYMPPEQFAGSDIDHRADIYALGATVYHALAGRMPFEGTTVWEIMLKKAEAAPRLPAPVSPESADLVAEMMAAAAADRIASYQELIDRIDALPCLCGAPARTSPRLPAVPKAAPAPEPGTEPEPADPGPLPGRRQRGAVLAALAGVVLVGGIVLAVTFLGGEKPRAEIAADQAPEKVREFVAGDQESLFDRTTVVGWNGAGSAWAIVQDDEKTTVLTGTGWVRRPFRAPRHFRVVLALDLFEAATAEVVVAVADGPPASAKQWVVRIDAATGAAFGLRDGPEGTFQALGPTVPVPNRSELGDARPYQQVRYERAGGRFRANFLGQPLGEIEDDGKMKSSEVKVFARGGAIRIETADVEELVEKP